MRVEPNIYPSRPFRPRLHATLPEDWTKSSLLTLVSGIAHLIGLNATDVMVLRRIAQKTRAPDYADPTRSPVCFERQIDMAASIGLSAEQWRRVERKLERLSLIARETAANGYRGRVSGSIGPRELRGAVARAADRRGSTTCRRSRLAQVEMSERLALCPAGDQQGAPRDPAARVRSRRSPGPEPPSPRSARPGSRRAATVRSRSPRRISTLSRALVEKLKRIIPLSSKMTGAAVTNDRCHKQTTTETSSESCRLPDGPKEGREKKHGASDAGVNDEFMACLTVAKLRDLATDDLRLYIDHAPGAGGGGSGTATLSDIDWAVLRRLRDLGINPSAFEEAVEAMGWLRAMLAVMVIDRNRAHPTKPILSCGGALRAFTRRHRQGALDLRASIFGIWGREGQVQ